MCLRLCVLFVVCNFFRNFYDYFPGSVSVLIRALLLECVIFGMMVHMFGVPLRGLSPCRSVLWKSQSTVVVIFKLLSCLAVRICNSRSFPCVDEDSGSEEETLQYFSAVDPNYRSRRKKKLDSQNKSSQSFLSVLLNVNHGLMAVFTDVKVQLHHYTVCRSEVGWDGVSAGGKGEWRGEVGGSGLRCQRTHYFRS